MDNKLLYVLAALVIIAVFVWCCKRRENFDAAGLVFNVPPEWFNKQSYNPSDWIVAYSPDQLSMPGGCDMHYRGDPEELNYYSSAYRFWRF
jgi:hypothetical protein